MMPMIEWGKFAEDHRILLKHKKKKSINVVLFCQVWQNQSCKHLTHSAQGNWHGDLKKDLVEMWFVTYLPILPTGVSQPLKVLSHIVIGVWGTGLLLRHWKSGRRHGSLLQGFVIDLKETMECGPQKEENGNDASLLLSSALSLYPVLLILWLPSTFESKRENIILSLQF